MKVHYTLSSCSYILITVFSLLSFTAFSNDSLVIIGKKILEGETDSIRIVSNTYFEKKIKHILLKDPELTYSFDSVKNISVLLTSKKDLRIITWILPQTGNKSYKYFGYIQTAKSKKNPSTLFELKDRSTEIQKAEDAKLSPENWYGALYYKLIEQKSSGKKYYTLLGWKGNNQLSTKKVIDVLSFKGNIPAFSSNIFKIDKKLKYRLILEYNALAVTSVKYDEKKKMIIMDHLSPPTPEQTGIYESYGPDFSYDGLKFKFGKWNLVSDIIPTNKSESKKKFKEPQKGLMPKK